MGTVAGLRTRRYHGLLVVAVDGPAEPHARPRVARSGARLRRRPLPARHRRMGERRRSTRAATSCSSSFDLDDGVPRWRWQIGGVVLERELAMAHGSPTVGVVHRLVASDRPVRLELTPLCTWRSVHGERLANGDPGVESDERRVRVRGRLPRRRRRVGSRAASGIAASAPGRRRRAGSTTARISGPRARSRVELEPGSLPRGDRRCGAVRRGLPPRRR